MSSFQRQFHDYIAHKYTQERLGFYYFDMIGNVNGTYERDYVCASGAFRICCGVTRTCWLNCQRIGIALLSNVDSIMINMFIHSRNYWKTELTEGGENQENEWKTHWKQGNFWLPCKL